MQDVSRCAMGARAMKDELFTLLSRAVPREEIAVAEKTRALNSVNLN